MATSKKLPTSGQRNKDVPEVSQTNKELPDAAQETKELPDAKQNTKALPISENPENTIVIGDALVEIKPTKLRYQRNNTFNFYKILETYPLIDILNMDIGDGRDGDKAVMDWLIAVFDDEEFVREHYDEMDTGTIEKLITITRRVNHIDEKEERLKNVLAPREKKG